MDSMRIAASKFMMPKSAVCLIIISALRIFVPRFATLSVPMPLRASTFFSLTFSCSHKVLISKWRILQTPWRANCAGRTAAHVQFELALDPDEVQNAMEMDSVANATHAAVELGLTRAVAALPAHGHFV